VADARTALREARRRGVTVAALVAGSLDDISEISPDGRQGLARLGYTLAALRRAPDIATGLARYVFGQTALGARLLVAPGGDGGDLRESAARVAQVLALARGYDDQQRSGGQIRGGADWVGFLDYVRVVAALRQESGADVSDLTLEDGVRVLTVHASKGLEFPVVYLPGLAERRFPMQRQWEPAPLPPPVREHAGLGDAGAVHLAEEACLFYVGLTRARDELVLSHAERYGRMRYQPSQFLAPIRDRLGSTLRVTKWSLPSAKTPTKRGDAREAGNGARDEFTHESVSEPDALTISALETYARCPKQFAYRYRDGLRPREVGLSTLRRSLHATLRELHDKLSTDAREASSPSLDDALALFESVWREAVDGERGALSQPTLPVGETATDAEPGAAGGLAHESRGSTFDDVYRRHGRDVVTRVWSSLQAPLDAADSGEESQALSPRAAFDETVTVRVHEHDITVSLDRVEAARTWTRSAGAEQRVATRQREEPARVVRHKLGLGKDQGPDLRALLYRLAAIQSHGEQVDLFQQNLTTGAVEPIDFDQRRLTKLYDELDEIIAGIERGDFAARPNPMTCNACPFLLICPT
jgi:CRISPR/Cas system-associated exonuclease Cas4 (RecB family)